MYKPYSTVQFYRGIVFPLWFHNNSVVGLDLCRCFPETPAKSVFSGKAIYYASVRYKLLLVSKR